VLRPCTVAQVTSGGSINYMISEVMYVLHTGTHLFIYLPCVYAVPYRLNDLWVIYSLYDSDFTTCLRITNRSTVVWCASMIMFVSATFDEDSERRKCPLSTFCSPDRISIHYLPFTNDYPCHGKKLPHARFNV
jgi:hypothetical protein